jgi:hypothetical protein
LLLARRPGRADGAGDLLSFENQRQAGVGAARGAKLLPAHDFLSDANVAPNGFDVAVFAADLAIVGQLESPPFDVPPVNPPAPVPPIPTAPTADDVRAKVRAAFDAEIKSAQEHLHGRFLVGTMTRDAQLADAAVAEAFNGQ